jgi:hypothetical protein
VFEVRESYDPNGKIGISTPPDRQGYKVRTDEELNGK